MNAKRLTYTLIIASLVCLLAFIVGVLRTPMPRRHDFFPGQTLTQKGNRAVLYELGRTNVGIVDGDIFSIRSIDGMSDADIGISVRQTAGMPFEESAHKTLIEKLDQQAGGDRDKVLSLFKNAYNAHLGSEPWAHALPLDWKVRGARVFILAALPARMKGEVFTTGQISDKEHRIRDVVMKACIAAQSSSSPHLAITLIGEGAAGVPKDNVIPALFDGVNDAAGSDGCPPKVTFVTYSEDDKHGKSKEEQDAWLEEVALKFDKELKSDPSNWKYQRYPLAISQFFLVAIAPMLAGLVALRIPRLAGRVWAGPIAFNVAKWAALVMGVNGYAQLARGELTPQPFYILVIAMLFAFALPLVEWLKLSEMRGLSDNPTATVIDHEES
ncbi:MAG TPA: hypothetical protein VIW80_06325 [Pyrinomonadaceae bacterium]